ncbi:MAG: hypothetical protein PHH85_06030 [Candidatus Methanoperedens sp.]|nr:hypothetical protein [Candidatus Methanoperedens sp.]
MLDRIQKDYGYFDFMFGNLNLESVAKRFKEVVLETRIIKLPSGEPAKLRIEIVDGSFADIWLSASGKYSYHYANAFIFCITKSLSKKAMQE